MRSMPLRHWKVFDIGIRHTECMVLKWMYKVRESALCIHFDFIA